MIDITLWGVRLRIGIEDREGGRFYGVFLEREGEWSLDIGLTLVQ